MTDWPPDIGVMPYYQDDAVVIFHSDCRDILPLLPGSWVKWMAKKGLAAKLPYHPILRQAIVALAAIFQNDRRYRQVLKLLFARKYVP